MNKILGRTDKPEILTKKVQHKKSKKEKKVMRKLKQVLLACVLGIVAVALSGCGSTTIDLNKYVTIEAEGYDSMGRLNVTFDYDAFEKDYDGKIKAKVKSSDGGTAAEIALVLALGDEVVDTFLSYCVDYKLDKYSELSNGDAVNFKWNCEDKDAERYFNVKLKYSDIKYTVKGLTKVATFDPFEYVSVEFSGVSPYGTAAISQKNDKTEMQNISLSADKSSGLSNGDKVTVTAGLWNVDSFVEQFGVVPSPLSKEFTVEGLPSYVSSVTEINEGTLDTMKQTVENDYKNLVDNRTDGWLVYWGRDYERDKLVSFTYQGNYFLTRKTAGFTGWEPRNSLYLVYKVDVVVYNLYDKEASGNPGSFYYFAKFNNLALNGDGTLAVDLNQYERPSHNCYFSTGDWVDTEFKGYSSLDALYEKCIQSVQNDYTFENNIVQ